MIAWSCYNRTYLNHSTIGQTKLHWLSGSNTFSHLHWTECVYIQIMKSKFAYEIKHRNRISCLNSWPLQLEYSEKTLRERERNEISPKFRYFECVNIAADSCFVHHTFYLVFIWHCIVFYLYRCRPTTGVLFLIRWLWFYEYNFYGMICMLWLIKKIN